jgi:NAD(P)-dependent dehydrogenase (short-subunit alcohol dehydrogenase family)
MTDLMGRTALVAGSTSGIGEATAIALAARVLVVGDLLSLAVPQGFGSGGFGLGLVPVGSG